MQSVFIYGKGDFLFRKKRTIRKIILKSIPIPEYKKHKWEDHSITNEQL